MRSTGHTLREAIEQEITSFGLVKQTDAQGKVRWHAHCDKCGKEDDCFRADLRDADQMIAHFQKRGWVLSRKAATYCSTSCLREAREQLTKQRATERENEVKHPTATSTPAVNAVAGTTIGPDPKMMRRVFALLEDHFDSEKRVYRSGYNDERVAKEGGASLEFVVKYRREAYGELAEDPEIAKLRDDLKAFSDLFTGQLKALESSFASHYNELSGRMEKLGLKHNKAAG